MTAMDFWMSCCKLFVGLTILEYAMQLKIRFGTRSKIATTGERERNTQIEEKCHKFDHYALMIMLSIYILTVGFYFYKFYYISRIS